MGWAIALFAIVNLMSSTGPPDSPPNLEPRFASIDQSDLEFWFFTWLGTVMAGSAFGIRFGFLPGLIVGTIVAGIVGVPILLTFGVLSWACWLTRFSIPLAIASGACTGIVSTLIVGGMSLGSEVWLAGTTGAVGAGSLISLYVLRNKGSKFSIWRKREKWRYSLGDLFIRFTVVTVLIAGWTAGAKLYFGS